MALWYLLFCSKVHQNSQTMHWISNWLLKPGGMLFFSREWLENFSELFLVRKVDFLKLNSVRKLILERKKKTHPKKPPQYFTRKETHWHYTPAKRHSSFVEKDRNKPMLSQYGIIQLLNIFRMVFILLFSPLNCTRTQRIWFLFVLIEK